ncbi:MAG: sulfite exporter TauE/SafE family protein [Ilumatobacteraceae bacterium]
MFSAGDYVIGAIAALIVGLSKTALPGAGLLATPLLAMVVEGRAIPGTTLPILVAADLFAVAWYSRSARWDLLRPMVPWVAAGFVAGAAFFVAIGNAPKTLNVVIGWIVLVIVAIQVWRMVRRSPSAAPSVGADAFYGTSGGFATFVSNNAGPILNTHLLRLGLDKRELVGTSAWFYFTVNLSKIPIYLALGAWSDGGHFFTGSTLRYDALLVPGVVLGAVVRRRVFEHIPQRPFIIAVLVFATAGSARLILA